ncbi:MAG TPA: MotA/TolQ/ExbB proton channel family protein [Myxococcota bacterium]|nr:MotA/TolQ/ExbB proton channel family protein [Myxococcota bacterium]
MFSVIEVFEHAGPVGLFVMGVLVLFSVVSWAIILAKWQSIRGLLFHNAQFIDQFWQTKDLNLLVNTNNARSPSLQVFKDGVHEVERQKQRGNEKDDAFLVIERALARSGRYELKKAESQLPMLATIGAISPFIGLFGTVVGIMSSFHQIGQAGNANLSTVAPGIAEALLATALGLFAAIPAVMAYNMLQTKLRLLKGDLENFCLDLLAVLRSQR